MNALISVINTQPKRINKVNTLITRRHAEKSRIQYKTSPMYTLDVLRTISMDKNGHDYGKDFHSDFVREDVMARKYISPKYSYKNFNACEIYFSR